MGVSFFVQSESDEGGMYETFLGVNDTEKYVGGLVISQTLVNGDGEADVTQRISLDLVDCPDLPSILRELADAIEEDAE